MRLSARRGQVRPLRVPDVLLAVGGEDLAGGGDEVCCIIEHGPGLVFCVLDNVSLNDGTRDETDTQLLGEMLVG